MSSFLLPSAALRRIPWEAVAWAAGLVALACTDPNAEGLFSLCLFKAVGVPFCPGCGLGHAVAHLFRGEFLLSFQAHPLGVPAVLVLTGRIVALVRESYFSVYPKTDLLTNHL